MNRHSAFAVAFAATATAVLGLSASPASAITLVDENSTAEFDLTSQAGLFDWIVDGTDHLFQEWFWYRIGDEGPEQSIDTLTLDLFGATDTNFDGDDDTLFARYIHDLFELTIKWSLDGGAIGSGASDIGEQISITNTSGSNLAFNFYEYTDFDINDSAGDDEVEFKNSGELGQFFIQRDAGSQGGVFEIALDLPPAIQEAAFFDDTISKLNDGDADDLNGFGGPLGPGDLTAAWQWKFDIGRGETVQISKDKQITSTPVPEPGAIGGLLAIGTFGIGVMLKRHRQEKNKIDL